MRWDYEKNGNHKSKIPLEYPGCSLSFDKFYAKYEETGNFQTGRLNNVPFLFVHSARKAIEVEINLLKAQPTFVNCNRMFCTSCKLRFY